MSMILIDRPRSRLRRSKSTWSNVDVEKGGEDIMVVGVVVVFVFGCVSSLLPPTPPI